VQASRFSRPRADSRPVPPLARFRGGLFAHRPLRTRRQGAVMPRRASPEMVSRRLHLRQRFPCRAERHACPLADLFRGRPFRNEDEPRDRLHRRDPRARRHDVRGGVLGAGAALLLQRVSPLQTIPLQCAGKDRPALTATRRPRAAGPAGARPGGPFWGPDRRLHHGAPSSPREPAADSRHGLSGAVRARPRRLTAPCHRARQIGTFFFFGCKLLSEAYNMKSGDKSAIEEVCRARRPCGGGGSGGGVGASAVPPGRQL
jgi:hypothetical protein